MAFLFVKELTTTLGDTLGDDKGVEVSLLGCPEAPPAEIPLDVLTAPPDLLCSRSALEAAGSGGEGVGEVLPDLLKAPPDSSNPGLYPDICGDVCGSS